VITKALLNEVFLFFFKSCSTSLLDSYSSHTQLPRRVKKMGRRRVLRAKRSEAGARAQAEEEAAKAAQEAENEAEREALEAQVQAIAVPVVPRDDYRHPEYQFTGMSTEERIVWRASTAAEMEDDPLVVRTLRAQCLELRSRDPHSAVPTVIPVDTRKRRYLILNKMCGTLARTHTESEEAALRAKGVDTSQVDQTQFHMFWMSAFFQHVDQMQRIETRRVPYTSPKDLAQFSLTLPEDCPELGLESGYQIHPNTRYLMMDVPTAMLLQGCIVLPVVAPYPHLQLLGYYLCEEEPRLKDGAFVKERLSLLQRVAKHCTEARRATPWTPEESVWAESPNMAEYNCRMLESLVRGGNSAPLELFLGAEFRDPTTGERLKPPQQYQTPDMMAFPSEFGEMLEAAKQQHLGQFQSSAAEDIEEHTTKAGNGVKTRRTQMMDEEERGTRSASTSPPSRPSTISTEELQEPAVEHLNTPFGSPRGAVTPTFPKRSSRKEESEEMEIE
jgi:hypothetical protein